MPKCLAHNGFVAAFVSHLPQILLHVHSYVVSFVHSMPCLPSLWLDVGHYVQCRHVFLRSISLMWTGFFFCLHAQHISSRCRCSLSSVVHPHVRKCLYRAMESPFPPPTPCASFEYFVMCSIAHLCADVSNNISLQPQAGEKHPVAEPVRAFRACSGPALQTASGPWQCRPWRCTPNQFSAMHSLCHFAIRSKLTGGCHCMGYPAEFYVVCPQFDVALHYFCMLCEMHT